MVSVWCDVVYAFRTILTQAAANPYPSGGRGTSTGNWMVSSETSSECSLTFVRGHHT